MTRINRAAWQRIKERVASHPKGTIYGGTITSITIDGRKFQVLDSDVVTRRRAVRGLEER